MNPTLSDGPNVIVFPPIIPITTLAMAICLNWLAPLGLIAAIGGPVRILFGMLFLVAGAVTTMSGRRSLVRHGTNVNPRRPATALVTEGVFRRTRNPLYVGMFCALLGIAFVFCLDWLPFLIVPAGLIMHFAVVRREEIYLERKFGEEFRQYKLRVPRYVVGL